MTVDELITVRVCLTEASIVLGHALVEVERNNANANSKLMCYELDPEGIQ